MFKIENVEDDYGLDFSKFIKVYNTIFTCDICKAEHIALRFNIDGFLNNNIGNYILHKATPLLRSRGWVNIENLFHICPMCYAERENACKKAFQFLNGGDKECS